MLEIEAGTWVRASAVASVVAARPAAGPDPELLASLLDAEGAAAAVAAEVGRPSPTSAAPDPRARCYVRLLGETGWQRCTYPVDAMLAALAILSGDSPS
jgi:hypothetical protein